MSNEDLTQQFEADSPQQVNEIDNVRSLSTYVIQLQSLEDEVKIMEENLKRKKEAADKISEEVIPEIMEQMKLKTLKLQDGSAIEVKEIYGASIPVANREGAYKWLRDNDLGDLIKNEITVSFGRGEDNKANDYASLAEKNGYQPSQKMKVEHMTLKALYRERVENNQDLPSEHFNLFKGNKTKITRNK
jgi:membrane-associated HD superfamily phosphohydrolase